MTSISFLPNTQGSMITESSVLYFCEVTRDDPSAHDRTPKGIQFMEHRVDDPRILRLIGKWLKAGMMEEGQWSEPQTYAAEVGESPLLANVHLHYSFDLWVNVWRRSMHHRQRRRRGRGRVKEAYRHPSSIRKRC